MGLPPPAAPRRPYGTAAAPAATAGRDSGPPDRPCAAGDPAARSACPRGARSLGGGPAGRTTMIGAHARTGTIG